MNTYQKFGFFPFHWCCSQDRGEDNIIIRSYGWNKDNESVCLIINDFTIPVWIELPDDIEWTESKISIIKDKLKKITYGNNAPVSIEFKRQQRLYYADVIKKENKYVPMLFPFLELHFKGTYSISTFMKLACGKKFADRVDINDCRECKLTVPNVGDVKLRFHTYEPSISPVLKLFAIQNISSSNWMHVKAKLVPEDERITCKKYEYRVSYKNLTAFTVDECSQMPIMYPKIMSYDIEVFSSKAPAFPNANLSGDQVFQIGASMSQNVDGKRVYRKILLTIGKCNPIKDDVDPSGFADIRSFKNEKALYEGFKQLMIEEDPDVVIGYNIFKFDIEYIHNRILIFSMQVVAILSLDVFVIKNLLSFLSNGNRLLMENKK